MDIRIDDILKLDDYKEYVVVSKINYKNINYYFLTDINDLKNYKFLYENKDSLTEVNDKELLRVIIPMLYKEARKGKFDSF